MKTRIEKKESFKVAGVVSNTNKDSNFNNVWQELFKKADIDTLLSIWNLSIWRVLM